MSQNPDREIMLRMHTRLQRQGHRNPDPVQPATRQASSPPGIGSALLGINVSPVLAATLRALAYIVITAVLDIGILYFTSTPPAALAVYSVIIVGALRQIEGILDAALKPNMNAGSR